MKFPLMKKYGLSSDSKNAAIERALSAASMELRFTKKFWKGEYWDEDVHVYDFIYKLSENTVGDDNKIIDDYEVELVIRRLRG